MSLNMYNSSHKTSSEAYRKGYDAVKWDKEEEAQEEPSDDTEDE